MLSELFLLNFLMRKLRNSVSFVKQTKTNAKIEGISLINVQDELLYHMYDLLIGEKKRNKCNILMTSVLSGNNQAVSSK